MCNKQLYLQIANIIDNDYYLLDLPYHVNIGDLLIWQGEMEFLKLEVKHRMLGYSNQSTFGFPELKKDAVILLHGGGNFGDVWRSSQEFRLKVIQHYPDHKIIIFPQSVYYSNAALAIQDAEIFAHHKNLTICGRDDVSYNYLKRFFKNNILRVPDMAFWCDKSLFIFNGQKAKHPNLFLKRTDHEYRQVNVDFIDGEYDVKDWPGTENLSRFVKYLFLTMLILRRFWTKNSLCRVLARPLAWFINQIFMHYIRPSYISRGRDFIGSYDNIYTTRLHGLILAHLMNKNIYIVANNNGKLENYYTSWLKADSNISIIDIRKK